MCVYQSRVKMEGSVSNLWDHINAGVPQDFEVKLSMHIWHKVQ